MVLKGDHIFLSNANVSALAEFDCFLMENKKSASKMSNFDQHDIKIVQKNGLRSSGDHGTRFILAACIDPSAGPVAQRPYSSARTRRCELQCPQPLTAEPPTTRRRAPGGSS